MLNFDFLLFLILGWERTPGRIPSRILVISYRVFCCIMYAGYSAVIVSQCIVTTPPKPFNNMNDLVTSGKYKLGTTAGSHFVDYLKVMKLFQILVCISAKLCRVSR